MLRELGEHVRYRIDRVFARESLAQFVLLVVLVVVVTMIGMTAVFFGLFAPENANVESIPREIDRGFFDSLWWSLQQVLYLRTWERTYGATVPIVMYSLFLSLVGLAVFGILVSLINTSIERRLESLRKGDSLVKERGHVLILGWSQKVFSVLRQLSELEQGLKVVILAPREVEQMHRALRIEGVHRLRMRTILRTGTPSNLRELERVAFDRASNIIVLTQDERRSQNEGDSEVIKTLMLLSSYDDWSSSRPTITCEISQRENYEVAVIASAGTIPIVSSSTIISRIIVQSIRYPGVSHIYSEIFSFQGNGLQVGHYPRCADKPLGEVELLFRNAVPLGIAWSEEREGHLRHVAGLAPEPEYEIADDEQLILLARREPIRLESRAQPPASAAAALAEPASEPARTTLLIGWNGNIYDILTELDAHAGGGTRILVLSSYNQKVASLLLEQFIGRTLGNLEVEFLQGDAVHRSVLSRLPLEEIDSVVLLADESSGEQDLDARTMSTLLLLSDVLKSEVGRRRVHTVVELLTDTHLLDALQVDDVIVSPAVVSAQLAQISQQPILGTIYRELLSAGGIEIGLRPAAQYVPLDQPCGFEDLSVAAQRKLEIALGLCRRSADDEVAEILLNPDREQRWQLCENDRIVVLAQEIYR